MQEGGQESNTWTKSRCSCTAKLYETLCYTGDMTELIISVSDSLASRLQPFADSLPQLLEQGINDLEAESMPELPDDEAKIIGLLASNPTPEEVLALQPSSQLQAHASRLLADSKAGVLSRQGEAELAQIMLLERLVRLAKANAHKRLAQST